MKACIRQYDIETEYYFEEGCFITELSNTPDEPDISIAQARLEPGRTTRWHRLRDIVERYVLIEGSAVVEVEGLAPQEVNPGDVVVIPAQTARRISNNGSRDLVFLAICSPRFTLDAYIDIET